MEKRRGRIVLRVWPNRLLCISSGLDLLLCLKLFSAERAEDHCLIIEARALVRGHITYREIENAIVFNAEELLRRNAHRIRQVFAAGPEVARMRRRHVRLL